MQLKTPAEQKVEYGLLRHMYETARRYMRSTNRQEQHERTIELEEAIELIKDFDGGTSFVDEPSAAVAARANAIIENTSFDLGGAPYTIKARVSPRGEAYVQGSYMEPDTYTKVPAKQYTRRWILSPEMTDSEIVFTLFKLCLTSAEHRTREAFTYKGARVASPHFDVEDLVVLCQSRENAGGRSG